MFPFNYAKKMVFGIFHSYAEGELVILLKKRAIVVFSVFTSTCFTSTPNIELTESIILKKTSNGYKSPFYVDDSKCGIN